MYNFDEPIDRFHSDAYKWNRYAEGVNPHWVADMDFKAPQPVIDALHERVEHGVYGYGDPSPEHPEVIRAYLANTYDWHVEAEAIVWMPGIVCGFNVACRAYAQNTGRVLSLTPIYPPFLTAPKNFQQELCTVDMIDTGSTWEIDFDKIEAEFKQGVDVFLMCNPHNPVGRVYTRNEMEKLIDLCLRYDVTISSDEIHCDLILDTDKKHLPTASLNKDIAKKCVTFMAPSKTYNLPGLACCFAIIEDKALRKQFIRAKRGIIPDINVMGMHAAVIAYRDCETWKQELLQYLAKNRDELEKRIDAMPGLRMHHVEATYLAWIDARELSRVNAASKFEDAGVILSDGSYFDAPGFVRFNFGCTTALMNESLDRMQKVCSC